MKQQPTLLLAPLRGITDYIFRDVFHRHFKGFDGALAPFILPQTESDFPDKLLKDVLPENNHGLPVVPQLLHNKVEPFIILAGRLHELGYRHINWNLGCPAPQVVKKRRGSGMLQYPDAILEILDSVLPKLDKMEMELSIKMRLGYQKSEESFLLLPKLNSYPLKEITIHTRLGYQIYKGETDVASFGRCLELSNHPLLYNGDIVSSEDFVKLKKRYPATKGWMIGRGAIARPSIGEEIKGIVRGNLTNRIAGFHEELFQRYSEAFSGDSHITGRMKQIWSYLIASFPEADKKNLKKIVKSRGREGYLEAANELFLE